MGRGHREFWSMSVVEWFPATRGLARPPGGGKAAGPRLSRGEISELKHLMREHG